jgi:hypothetical protein
VVTVLSDGQVFHIGVWSPWTGSGQFVAFGAAPEDLITFDTVDQGGSGPGLTGGQVSHSTTLGHYQLGRPYRLAIAVDRDGGTITTDVAADDRSTADASVGSDQFPTLPGNAQLSLTASTLGDQATSHVVLGDYALTLSHQRSWASKIDDPVARSFLAGLAVVGVLLFATAVATGRPSIAIARLVAGIRSIRVSGLVAGAVALYLIGNALLFPLGGHPFDMGGEKLWAYVARVYGIAQLYYLTSNRRFPTSLCRRTSRPRLVGSRASCTQVAERSDRRMSASST